MSSGMPELGSKISLISKADIRYEGRLFTVDPQECTIALASVRSFGTEDRETQYPVAPQSQVYDYILFRGSDIKDIRVLNNVPSLPNDPAIMQMSVPASLGAGGAAGQYSAPYAHPVVGQPPYAQYHPMAGFPGGGVHAQLPKTSELSPHADLAPPAPGPVGSMLPHHVNQVKDQGSVLELLGGSRAGTPHAALRRSPTADQGTQAGAGAGGGAGAGAGEARRGSAGAGSKPQRASSRTRTRYPSGGAHHPHPAPPPQHHTQPAQHHNQPAQHHNQPAQHHNQPAQHHNQPAQHHNQTAQHHNQTTQHHNQAAQHHNQSAQHHHQSGQNYNMSGGGGYGRGGWRGRARGRGRGFVPRNKNTLKFDNDYDFEQANTEFEELRTQLAKTKISDDAGKVEEPAAPAPAEADKKDDSGNETGAGEPELDDDGYTGYDKTKSFFDNISCEAVERSKGRSQRTDWRTERKLNSETFGVASARRGAWRGRAAWRHNPHHQQMSYFPSWRPMRGGRGRPANLNVNMNSPAAAAARSSQPRAAAPAPLPPAATAAAK